LELFPLLFLFSLHFARRIIGLEASPSGLFTDHDVHLERNFEGGVDRWDPLPYGYAPTSDGKGLWEHRSKL
jgi:hypothetical protein